MPSPFSPGGNSGGGDIGDNLDSNQDILYKNAQIGNLYTLISGAFCLPIAETPPTDPTALTTWTPTVIVQGFADYRMRHVRFKARKEYMPPLIPTPQTTGVFQFLGGSVNLPFPSLNTAGGFTWDAQTDYVFVENAYTGGSDCGYIIGNLPFEYQLQADIQNSTSFSVPNAPQSVQQAGINVQTGYNLGQNIDFSDPYYSYAQPSYFPATFQSTSLIVCPVTTT